jgi:hypothetical protein
VISFQLQLANFQCGLLVPIAKGCILGRKALEAAKQEFHQHLAPCTWGNKQGEKNGKQAEPDSEYTGAETFSG